MVVLHIQVKARYSEAALGVLLETMRRRGAFSRPVGNGRYRVHVPAEHPWIPFYQTIQDCNSVDLTEVITVKRTVPIEPEG